MKRRIVMLLVFLLAGAIVNVAVAWGCGLWAPMENWRPMAFRKQVPTQIATSVPADWLTKSPNASFIMMFHRELSGPACHVIQFGVSEAIPGMDQLGPSRVLHIERLGWPLLALECEGRLDWMNVRGVGYAPAPPAWFGGFAVPASLKPRDAPHFMFPPYQRPLPFHPFWPGFAINTLFYAAVLWLLFAAPLALRRSRRIKRGLCPACAYPVGTSDVCTECGKPVKPTTV